LEGAQRIERTKYPDNNEQSDEATTTLFNPPSTTHPHSYSPATCGNAIEECRIHLTGAKSRGPPVGLRHASSPQSLILEEHDAQTAPEHSAWHPRCGGRLFLVKDISVLDSDRNATAAATMRTDGGQQNHDLRQGLVERSEDWIDLGSIVLGGTLNSSFRIAPLLLNEISDVL